MQESRVSNLIQITQAQEDGTKKILADTTPILALINRIIGIPFSSATPPPEVEFADIDNFVEERFIRNIAVSRQAFIDTIRRIKPDHIFRIQKLLNDKKPHLDHLFNITKQRNNKEIDSTFLLRLCTENPNSILLKLEELIQDTSIKTKYRKILKDLKDSVKNFTSAYINLEEHSVSDERLIQNASREILKLEDSGFATIGNAQFVEDIKSLKRELTQLQCAIITGTEEDISGTLSCIQHKRVKLERETLKISRSDSLQIHVLDSAINKLEKLQCIHKNHLKIKAQIDELLFELRKLKHEISNIKDPKQLIALRNVVSDLILDPVLENGDKLSLESTEYQSKTCSVSNERLIENNLIYTTNILRSLSSKEKKFFDHSKEKFCNRKKNVIRILLNEKTGALELGIDTSTKERKTDLVNALTMCRNIETERDSHYYSFDYFRKILEIARNPRDGATLNSRVCNFIKTQFYKIEEYHAPNTREIENFTIPEQLRTIEGFVTPDTEVLREIVRNLEERIKERIENIRKFIENDHESPIKLKDLIDIGKDLVFIKQAHNFIHEITRIGGIYDEISERSKEYARRCEEIEKLKARISALKRSERWFNGEKRRELDAEIRALEERNEKLKSDLKEIKGEYDIENGVCDTFRRHISMLTHVEAAITGIASRTQDTELNSETLSDLESLIFSSIKNLFLGATRSIGTMHTKKHKTPKSSSTQHGSFSMNRIVRKITKIHASATRSVLIPGQDEAKSLVKRDFTQYFLDSVIQMPQCDARKQIEQGIVTIHQTSKHIGANVAGKLAKFATNSTTLGVDKILDPILSLLDQLESEGEIDGIELIFSSHESIQEHIKKFFDSKGHIDPNKMTFDDATEFALNSKIGLLGIEGISIYTRKENEPRTTHRILDFKKISQMRSTKPSRSGLKNALKTGELSEFIHLNPIVDFVHKTLVIKILEELKLIKEHQNSLDQGFIARQLLKKDPKHYGFVKHDYDLEKVYPDIYGLARILNMVDQAAHTIPEVASVISTIVGDTTQYTEGRKKYQDLRIAETQPTESKNSSRCKPGTIICGALVVTTFTIMGAVIGKYA